MYSTLDWNTISQAYYIIMHNVMGLGLYAMIQKVAER